MKIGNYELNAVETTIFGLDGGAMFGVVPKTIWSRNYNAGDEQNRIPLAARPLLISSNNRKILVDTGNGDKFDEKFASIYSIDREQSNIVNALQRIGTNADEITDVILTHLHFDHCGGATSFVNGKFVPTFPNAQYYVQKEQINWSEKNSEKDRASFIKENWECLSENSLLVQLDGDCELFDGIEIIVSNGHTRGMSLVKISDGSKSLVYCADLCPTASHVGIPYSMGYDNEPLIVIEEKKKLFPKFYNDETILFFEHDAFIKAGKLAQHKDWFKVEPVSFD